MKRASGSDCEGEEEEEEEEEEGGALETPWAHHEAGIYRAQTVRRADEEKSGRCLKNMPSEREA